MSKSLEQAATENAIWESTKARLDERVRQRLTMPDAPVVPPPSFPAPLRNRVENFGYNFRDAFDRYVTELSADGSPQTATKIQREGRVRALQNALVNMVGKHEEFFRGNGDQTLVRLLDQATTPGSEFYSEKNADTLAEARDMVRTLKMQFVVEQGASGKVLRAPPSYSTDDFFAAHSKSFDGYIAELRKLSKQQGVALKDRADNMERMLNGLKQNVEGFFHNKRDVALKQFMMDSYTLDSVFFSTNYGNGMNQAVKDFTRLQARYADQGAMLLP